MLGHHDFNDISEIMKNTYILFFFLGLTFQITFMNNNIFYALPSVKVHETVRLSKYANVYHCKAVVVWIL